jgi:hemoglobin
MIKLQSQSLYFRLGGAPAVRKFVDNLYDFMDYFTPVENVRKMYPKDLSDARNRLFMFLSGLLGGPPLYEDDLGCPGLRQKHMHLKIGDKERDQWLFCAQNAANQLDIDSRVRDALMMEITEMAYQLHNQGGVLSRQNGWQSDRSYLQ